MTTRAGNAGILVFERGRGWNLRKVLIVLSVMVCLLFYVGGKVQIMRLGYQIEALEQEKRELERENRSMLIEAASLSAPVRIEEFAVKRLGMVRPAKENIVSVQRKTATK